MNHHPVFPAVPPLNWVLFLLLGGLLIAAYVWPAPRPTEDGAE